MANISKGTVMKNKIKKIITTICVMTLLTGLSSSALAETGLNSQNMISFVGLDDEPGTSDDVVFDANDITVISDCAGEKLEYISNAIESKGGTVPDNTYDGLIEGIESIPTVLRTEYITTSGDIQFTYHHHTIDNTNKDNNVASGGTYGDDYTTTSSQGCYNVPIYHSHNNSCYCNGTKVYQSYYIDGDSRNRTVRLYCNSCGKLHATWNNYDGYCDDGYWIALENYEEGKTEGKCGALKCNKAGQIEGYKCGCGKRDGQIVAADIVYNN